LLQRRATDCLPNVSQVATLVRFLRLRIAAQRNLTILRIDDLGVLAIDLERGPNTGEDQVGAADALLLEAIHPLPDAPR